MTSHIKLLKGYGISIRQKDHQILLANGKDVFTGEQKTESYYIPQIPYEKIIISGDGYLSTRAVQLLLANNVNLILTDGYGNLITSMSTPMNSIKATKYRIGQYQTFSDESKQIMLRKKFLSMKLENQMNFLFTILV